MAVSKAISKFANDYEDWVSAHPCSLAEIETALKYTSYVLTSRFQQSTLFSELIYTVYKLWAFFNDQIIYKKACIPGAPNIYENKLKKWLTIINHCEVLFELSADKIWGVRGKWTFITIIQLFKCAIRLYLFLIEKEQIVEVCPIEPLIRKNYVGVPDNIALKSGRRIRTVNSVTKENRLWSTGNVDKPDKRLNKHQSAGEYIYIAKPLVHLSFMYCFGEKSWITWLIPYGIDLYSLYLLSNSNKELEVFSRRQRVEMTRRTLNLFLYLLRSPFFDYYTKVKLIKMLTALSRLPLFGLFFKSSGDYLPQWQQIYFYMWSS